MRTIPCSFWAHRIRLFYGLTMKSLPWTSCTVVDSNALSSQISHLQTHNVLHLCRWRVSHWKNLLVLTIAISSPQVSLQVPPLIILDQCLSKLLDEDAEDSQVSLMDPADIYKTPTYFTSWKLTVNTCKHIEFWLGNCHTCPNSLSLMSPPTLIISFSSLKKQQGNSSWAPTPW